MDNEALNKAISILREYVEDLAVEAGFTKEYGDNLFEGICASAPLLKELSYYHDYSDFLCEYKIEGYTLTDILVWQVDHFKLYMDRAEDMNRYRTKRLLLSAFEIMLEMEKDPAPVIKKLKAESGQDAANS